MKIIAVVAMLFGTGLSMTTPDITTNTPTTKRFIDCSGYRSHPTNPNMFQALDGNNVYADQTCFGVLIWSQVDCACMSPPCTDDDPNCEGHRAVADNVRGYEICVWGQWQEKVRMCPINQIWNQTGCRCDWDPLGPRSVVVVPVVGVPECVSIFNATFDSGIKDEGFNQYSVGREPWGGISLDHNENGIRGGGAVRAKNAGLPLWFTSGNDLGNIFQIQLRFKVVDSGQGEVTLLSNACGHDRTTLYIRHSPSDQSFTVFFRNRANVGDTMRCVAQPFESTDFHDLSLEYRENRMVLKVDGSECFTTDKFKGRIAVTVCPVILGGRPGGPENFDGYFDEVIIRRNCIKEA